MHRRALFVLVGLALVVRVAAVVATDDYRPTGDPADYDLHAITLSVAGTYPPTAYAEPGGASALRPPAYPYLLAGVYEITGQRWTAGRLAGAALGALAVGLLFVLARSVAGASVARWTAGLAAVFPPLVALSTSLVAEALFLPLMLGAVLCLLALRDAPKAGWALGAGALIGLAAMTRSNGIVLVAPAALAIWLGTGAVPVRRRLAVTAALVAATALVLTPWTVRNADAFGRLLPLGTQSGYTLAGQYNAEAAREDAFHVAWRVPQTVPAYADLFGRPGLDEADVDAALSRRARRFIADHPGFVADAVAANALRLFDLGAGHRFVSGVSFTEMGIPPRFQRATGWTIRLALALAVAGLVVLVAGRRRPGPGFVWAVPVLMFVSVVGLLGAPRYRAPVDPFLLLLGGVALASFACRMPPPRALRRPRASATGATSSSPASAPSSPPG